ncbi:MAG: transporter substrate-binding domain-containing protein [Pseudomonadota bacterium]
MKENRFDHIASVACLLVLGLLGSPARAEAPAPGWKVEMPDVAPWVFHAQPEHPGVLLELVAELARQAKLPLRPAPIVYARMAHDLDAGVADMAIGLDSPVLRQAGTPLATLFAVRTIIVGRADRPPVTPETLCSLTIGMVRGTWYNADIAGRKCLKIHRVKDIAQGVQMVLAGRLDQVMGTDFALQHAIAAQGVARSAFSEATDMGQADFVLYARAGLPANVAARAKAAAEDFARSKAYPAIAARYRE